MNNTNNVKTLSLKNDIVFKELFSKSGNEIFLKDFLSDLLDLNIKEIKICKDASLKRDFISDKYGILDIKAILDNEKIIDIEMQVADNKNIEDRSLYYASKLISEQLISGNTYNKLKPVIIICLLDFVIVPFDNYITETITVAKENKDYEMQKKLKFIYVELPKFRNLLNSGKISQNKKTNQWLTFIDGENKKGVVEVMKKNNVIKKADEELQYLTGDEEVRRLADLRQKYIMDYNSGIASAKEEGIKEGIEQERINMIKSMLNKKLDIKIITDITGLTEKEIKKLS